MKIYKKQILNNVIILIILFISQNSLAQIHKKNEIIAKAGNKVITSEEFRKRAEMTPHLLNNLTDAEFKERFLYTLIHEKLWSQLAESEGLLTTPLIKYSLDEIKKMYTRDELYKREVMNRVNIDESEIKKLIPQCRKILYLNYITEKDEKEINRLYSELKSGKSYTQVLKGRKEALLQENPVKVECGQVDSEREKLFNSLSPGEYTKPVKTEIGWVIFYLKEVQIESDLTNNALYSKAKKILEQKKYKSLYEEFNKKYLGGKRIEINDTLFSKLYTILQEKIDGKTTGNNINGIAALDFYDIYSILDNFSSTERKSVFLNFSPNPILLKDYIGAIAFKGIKIKIGENFDLRNFLAKEIKNYIRLEILYRAAVKLNYDQLPEVQTELNLWRDNYLAQMAKSKFKNSIKISDEEIENYFIEKSDNSSATMIKTVQITTQNLDDINSILKILNTTKDLETAYKNMEHKAGLLLNINDFEPLHKFESFGVTNNSQKGDLFGPIQEENKYYLLKIKEIKKSVLIDTISFKSNRDGIKQELYFKKLKNFLDDKTIELAEKYGVKIDYKKLGKIKINQLNMVVMKFFGLGEQILAVPFTNQFYEWFYKWESKEKALP